jgi:hypothetical protein
MLQPALDSLLMMKRSRGALSTNLALLIKPHKLGSSLIASEACTFDTANVHGRQAATAAIRFVVFMANDIVF